MEGAGLQSITCFLPACSSAALTNATFQLCLLNNKLGWLPDCSKGVILPTSMKKCTSVFKHMTYLLPPVILVLIMSTHCVYSQVLHSKAQLVGPAFWGGLPKWKLSPILCSLASDMTSGQGTGGRCPQMIPTGCPALRPLPKAPFPANLQGTGRSFCSGRYACCCCPACKLLEWVALVSACLRGFLT